MDYRQSSFSTPSQNAYNRQPYSVEQQQYRQPQGPVPQFEQRQQVLAPQIQYQRETVRTTGKSNCYGFTTSISSDLMIYREVRN